MATGAVRLAGTQGKKDVHHGGVAATTDIGDKGRRHDRFLLRAKRKREQARVSDIVDVVAGAIALATALPIAGEGAIDEPRVERGEGLIAEAETRHHAGAELLDEHIRAARELENAGAIGLALEVADEAFLPPVEKGEKRALAPEARRVAAHLLSARPLDLDHPGAGLGENESCERTRQQRREIQNGDPGERLHLFNPSHRAGCRTARGARGHCGTRRSCMSDARRTSLVGALPISIAETRRLPCGRRPSRRSADPPIVPPVLIRSDQGPAMVVRRFFP